MRPLNFKAEMMWMDPTGVSWGGDPMLDVLRAKMPWPEMFFRDFIPSGFALLAVNGLPQLLSALMLFKKHPWAYRVMFACGIILMFWILLEWYVWGGVALSNIYFVLGLIEAIAAFYCIRKKD